MDRETVNAPSRHPIDLPRFSSLKGALRAPKLPTGLGPYDCSCFYGATALQVRKRGFTMLKLIALLPVIPLIGCTYDPSDRRYQVTDDFSDAQFAVMQAEVDKLCDLTDHCISITREEHWSKVFIGAISEQCNNGGGCWSQSSDGSHRISITPEAIARGDLAETWRHEMGHAAGCHGPADGGNLAEPGNVMYRYIYDIEWTDADLDCVEGIR